MRYQTINTIEPAIQKVLGRDFVVVFEANTYVTPVKQPSDGLLTIASRIDDDELCDTFEVTSKPSAPIEVCFIDDDNEMTINEFPTWHLAIKFARKFLKSR